MCRCSQWKEGQEINELRLKVHPICQEAMVVKYYLSFEGLKRDWVEVEAVCAYKKKKLRVCKQKKAKGDDDNPGKNNSNK